MQVFKVYFKIIKANAKLMSIYVIIFLTLSTILSISGAPSGESSFVQTKANVAFINLDQERAFIQGFKDYLSKYVNFVEVENHQEKLKDALFYREVEYIITVPANFTEDFLQGKAVRLEKTVVPDSTTKIYVDMAVNKYLNAARAYLNNVPAIAEAELAEEVIKAASSETSINLKTFGEKSMNDTAVVGYFNSLAYSLCMVLILGVSSNLLVFNQKSLKRRNLCSPMKDRTFNLQLIAANLVFSFAFYGIMVIFSFILNGRNMLSYKGLLLCISGLFFTIAALSISYLVGIVVKNKNAQSGVANILAVGLSFLGGAFVPQELLSEKVLAIASFNPIYWYVKANNAIWKLTSYSFDKLSHILTYLMIELGFALAIFSIALVVSKQNRLSSS